MSGGKPDTASDGGSAVRRDLPLPARRALEEAAERRRLAEAQAATDVPKEVHGRGGAEPVRYGDWEIKWLAVDF